MNSKFKKIIPLITLGSVSFLYSCNTTTDNNNSESDRVTDFSNEDILIDKDTGFSYIVKNNEVYIYSNVHYSPLMELKIPESINSMKVTGILYKSFVKKEFSKVIFPSTLKFIEDKAFEESTIQVLEFNGQKDISINNNAFKYSSILNIEVKNNEFFVFEDNLLSSKDKKIPYIIFENSKFINNINYKNKQIVQLDTRTTNWDNINNLNFINFSIHRLVISESVFVDSNIQFEDIFINSTNSIREVLNFSSSPILSSNFNQSGINLYVHNNGIIYLEKPNYFSVYSFDIPNSISYSYFSILDNIGSKPVQEFDSSSLDKITENFISSDYTVPSNIKYIRENSFKDNKFNSLRFEYEIDEIDYNSFINSETEELILSKEFIDNYKSRVVYSAYTSTNYILAFNGLKIKKLVIEDSAGSLSLYDLKFLGLKFDNIEYNEKVVKDTHAKIDSSINEFSFLDNAYKDFAFNKTLVFPENIKNAEYNRLSVDTLFNLSDSSFSDLIETIDIYNNLSFLGINFFAYFKNLKTINIYNPVDYTNYNIHSKIQVNYKKQFILNRFDKNIVDKILLSSNQETLFIPEYVDSNKITKLANDSISNNSSLKKIILASPDISIYKKTEEGGIEVIEDALSNLNNLESIDIFNPGNSYLVSENPAYKYNYFYNDRINNQEEIIINNQEILDNFDNIAFDSNLKTLSINSQVDPDNLNNNVFKNATNLSSIVIFDFKNSDLLLKWQEYLIKHNIIDVQIYFVDDIFSFNDNNDIKGFKKEFKDKINLNEVILTKLDFNFDLERQRWSGVISEDSFVDSSISQINTLRTINNNKIVIEKNSFKNNNIHFLELSDDSNIEIKEDAFKNNNISLIKLSNKSGFNKNVFDDKDILMVSDYYFTELKTDKITGDNYVSLKSIRSDAPESSLISLDNSAQHNYQLGKINYDLKQIESYAMSNYKYNKDIEYKIPLTVSSIEKNAFYNIKENSTINSFTKYDFDSDIFRSFLGINNNVTANSNNDSLFTSFSDIDINIYNGFIYSNNKISNLNLPLRIRDINIKGITKIEYSNLEIESLIIPEYIKYIAPAAFNNISPKKIINYSQLNFEDLDYLKSIGINYTPNIQQDIEFDYEKYLLYEVKEINNKSLVLTGLRDEFKKNNMTFLKIPAYINNIPVTEIEQSAFNNVNLTSLIFDENLDHEILIKKDAFSNNSIKSIKIDEKYIKIEKNDLLSIIKGYDVAFEIFRNNIDTQYYEISNSSNYYSYYEKELIPILENSTISYRIEQLTDNK